MEGSWAWSEEQVRGREEGDLLSSFGSDEEGHGAELLLVSELPRGFRFIQHSPHRTAAISSCPPPFLNSPSQPYVCGPASKAPGPLHLGGFKDRLCCIKRTGMEVTDPTTLGHTYVREEWGEPA